MSDIKKPKEHLREQLNETIEFASNTEIPIKEVAKELLGQSRAMMGEAVSLTAAKNARKVQVAERIAQLRQECHITQKEAAQATGINVITLSGYELGRSELHTEAMVRLADLYEVSLDYLLCRTDLKIKYTKEEGREEREIIINKIEELEQQIVELKREHKV